MNSSSGVNQSRQKSNQNIQVYVRVRPLNAREKGIRSHEVVDVAPPKEIIVRHPPDSKMTKKFTFDRTFGPDSTQTEVYHSVVAPLIEEVLAGYNCTVFAYGQTGTGKTHTMIGTECPELKSSWDDLSMIGIIPRALSHLFDELRMMEVEFSMRISYLELYNEELCDLLSTDDTTKIRIFDDSNKKGSVIIQGLEEIPVHSKDDVYKLLEKGKERRKTATTLMNAQSSRSHTVFSILVHIKENGMDGEEMLKIGKLNLVDLAGSENISKAGNEKGIRSRETVNINQSLLTLGRVITALVERTPHIPYRESKLTRLLQESLGGRTKTSIIATISPGHKDLEETLSTLEYAHRAKNIQNKPELNQKLTKKTVIKEYTEEIDKLKRDLMAARDKNGIYLAEETYNDMHFKLESQNKELTEKMLLIKALKDEMTSKEKVFNEVSLHLVEKSEELKKKDKVLQDAKSELDQTKKVLHTTRWRYKEKKVLLDSHVKTEKELTTQASKLIEVADIATTDTVQLHSSLERRQDVECKNQTAFQQLSGKMHCAFGMMSENLEDFLKEHESHSEIMKEVLESSLKLHKELSSKTVNNINSLSKNHHNFAEEFSDSIKKYSTELSDTYVIHKSSLAYTIEDLKKREENTKLNLETQLSEIKSLVKEQNSLLECTYSKYLQMTSARSQVNSDYFQQFQELARSNCDNINTQINEQQTILNSHIQEEESIHQERNQILTEIEQFHANLMQKMQLLKSRESAETDRVKQVPPKLELISSSLNNDMNNKIKSVGQFIDSLESDYNEQNNILTAFRDDTITFSTKLAEKVNSTHTIVSDTECERKENADELLKSVEKCGEDILIVGEKWHKHANSVKQESIKQMDIECERATQTITEACSRTNEFNTQNMALTTSLQTYVKEYTSNNKRHMNDCYQHIENFQNNELKAYSPTGQTPSKKEFSYPRILAATSPHNIIIKRFRYEHDLSDLDSSSATITEDSETTVNEISDNCTLVNSTPIKSTKTDMSKLLQPQNSFKIPQNLKNEDSISSRKNSPLLFFSKENKENCT